MKTALKLLLLLAIIGYLAFVFVHVAQAGSRQVCSSINVVITDSLHAGFINANEVAAIMRRAKVYPVGEKMDSVDSKKLEQTLKSNPFIKDAVCYKTPNGEVNVLVTQRLPVLRIIADNGDNYYIDDKGITMNPLDYEADLAVATGNIDKKFTKTYLVRLGCFLRSDHFWDNQIEQINVRKDKTIEIIPRIGNQVVYIGQPVNIQKKLRNLRALYEKVLPVVGWNKYSRINLEFENQIICTKNKD